MRDRIQVQGAKTVKIATGIKLLETTPGNPVVFLLYLHCRNKTLVDCILEMAQAINIKCGMQAPFYSAQLGLVLNPARFFIIIIIFIFSRCYKSALLRR